MSPFLLGVTAVRPPQSPGDGIVVGDVDFEEAAFGDERGGEAELHSCVGDDFFGGVGFPVGLDGDGLQHVAFGGFAGGHGTVARHEAGAGVWAIDVLVELDPEHVERVGAVVGVGDGFGGGEGFGAGVDAGGDFVVDAVLPVGGAGEAAGGAGGTWGCGEGEGGEGGEWIGRGGEGGAGGEQAGEESGEFFGHRPVQVNAGAG